MSGDAGPNLGRTLSDADFRKGLRELNPAISFDAAVNRPSEYHFVMSTAKEYMGFRGSVLYNGTHVCAYDRGVMPEWEIWQLEEGFQDIPMSDIDRHDQSKVIYLEILPSDPGYHYALTMAERGDDNFQLDGDGRVFKYRAVVMGKVPTKILRCGWRNVFEHLISRNIPGITRRSLELRFGVDLSLPKTTSSQGVKAM